MANGNRWSMSYRRRFTAFGLMAVGLFMGCFGVGLGSVPVLVLGLAIGVLGPAVLVLTAVRATTRQYIFGTAHVYSASPPPSAGMMGRCELHLAIFADGIDGVAVRVLDPAVPVSKWPDDGATLPIEVVANNPRKVRVLWDQVVTHAQAAGEDLYPQYVDSLPDDLEDDYDDLPPDDFLDDDDLGPVPPAPPARMPSGPGATFEAAGLDFAPVSAPMLVPPAATAPVAAPPTRVMAEGPTPVVVIKPDATDRAARGRRDLDDLDDMDDLDRLPDLGELPDLDDLPHLDELAADPDLDTDFDAEPDADLDTDLDTHAAEPGAPAGAAAPPLPLPRRRPSPHLRRPSPRPRRDTNNRIRPPSGINPVYVEEAPADPPPEWPFAPAGAPAPDRPERPESRPEPDHTEVVSGSVESSGALTGTIVDDHAYSDRSETDRMTFDRSSFRTVDVGPLEISTNGAHVDDEPAEPEDEVEQPFNVIPLWTKRAAPTEQAADDAPADAEDDDEEPEPDDGEALSTESTSYLTAPSAGLSQLGSGGFSVTLFVRELSRSIAFYRDILGLAEVDTGKNSAVLARGESRILLKRVNDLMPVDRRIVHLNLEVPDVQAAYEELKVKNVEFVHKPRVVSQGEQLELWAATFRDPDGHAIALTRWELRR